MNRKLLVLVLSFLLFFLTSCSGDSFSGQWTLKVNVEQVSLPECSNSFLGTGNTLYLEIAQEGNTISGYPIFSFESNAIRDTDFDRKVLGETNGNKADFYVWIPNAMIPDGCGDVNLFAGKLEGNIMTGTFQGGDCNSYPMNDTPSGSIVQQEVTGGPVEFCSWSGTFTMTKYEEK